MPRLRHSSIGRSLIDYMVTNLTVVASDWLNYNTGWWRGTNPNGSHKKWAYVLWDLDATFDYYINYSGVPNTNPDAVPCDIEEIADFLDGWFFDPIGMHEVIFLKLLDESPVFEQLYYSRYADLMNTAFSCEVMTHTFDSIYRYHSAGNAETYQPIWWYNGGVGRQCARDARLH